MYKTVYLNENVSAFLFEVHTHFSLVIEAGLTEFLIADYNWISARYLELEHLVTPKISEVSTIW